MRDVTAEIGALVASLMSEAKSGAKPELLTLSLACALENAAKAVREERDGLTIETDWHCRDCGRPWGVHVTVKQEREQRWCPENCPACHNAKQAEKRAKATPAELADRPWHYEDSGWTTKFRYLDGK